VSATSRSAAEALYHIDELLRQHPDLPFAHVNKGNALMTLGSWARKQSQLRAFELERAISRPPRRWLPSPATAANIQDAREWANARSRSCPVPDAVLCLAAAELAAGDGSSAEQRLRQVINDSRASAATARAHGLLRMCSTRGPLDEAFEAYNTCNQSLRQIHRRFASANVAGYARACRRPSRKSTPLNGPRSTGP